MNFLVIKRFVEFLIFLAGFHNAVSQEARLPILHNSIPAPVGLAVGGYVTAVTQDTALVHWIPALGALSYRLRLYKTDTDELEREISNLRFSILNIEYLDSGTNYSVTVSSVYRNRLGIDVESIESNPVRFRTNDECRGGQQWTECDGHCIASCENPDPVCSRVCSPGCNCLEKNTVWNGEQCIESRRCPTERGIPAMVENLHVINTRNPETGVILAWDIHEGAYIYEVTVRLAEDASVVIQSLETEIPIIGITNLTAGEIYAFRVIAYVRRTASISSRSALLPPPAYAVNITDSSFTVIWFTNPEAVRYHFVLFDGTGTNILYENKKLAGTSILLEELSPGTNYSFAIAAAGRSESAGIFSPARQVTTLGMKNANEPRGLQEIVLRIDTPATRTPMTAPSNRTVCLDEYQSVNRFYEKFPNATNGPQHPNCDDSGLYKTTICDKNNPSACKCINAQNGQPQKGSNFGGENSNFPLNCDNYGNLTVGNLTINLDRIRSNNVKISWNRIEEAHSYIVYMMNVDHAEEERTISVNAAFNTYVFRDLTPGNDYEFGVYVAEATGATSPLVTIPVTTELVDRPRRIIVLSQTRNNLTLTWEVGVNVEAFSVRLMLDGSNDVIQDLEEFTKNTITFNNLQTLQRYVVTIRAIGYEYARNLDEPIYHYSHPSSVTILIHCNIPPLDLIVAVESSSVANWTYLNAMKTATANLLTQLPPLDSPTGTRIAVLRYSNDPQIIFNFNRFEKTHNARGAILYIRHFGPRPANLGAVLRTIRSRFFETNLPSGFAKRKNAKSIVIVFTSGRLTGNAFSSAILLRNEVDVISAGIQGWSVPSGLRTVASSSNLILSASSIKDLRDSSSELLGKICSIVDK